jgi:hypothetical protein
MAVVFVKDSSKLDVYLFSASERKNGSPFVSYAYDKLYITAKSFHKQVISTKTKQLYIAHVRPAQHISHALWRLAAGSQTCLLYMSASYVFLFCRHI